MKVFSPKLRFKSMNFSRTTSTNFLTKSTKFFNTSRNQKSISNGFGSSFESIKTFKNFSPSYSVYKESLILYPDLKKNLLRYQRNKSSAFIKKINRYDNFYRKTMHNKFKSNINLYSNKQFISTEEIPMIIYDRKKEQNKERFENVKEKESFTTPNSSRGNITKMYCDKKSISPYHLVRGEYVNDIEKVLRGNLILLTQRNKLQDFLDIEKYKIDAINNYCYHIEKNKELLEKFYKDRNKYIKHLHGIISREQDILNILYGKKDILLIEIKSIHNKIEETKKILKQYEGYKLLINSIFNNDNVILSDPNILFDKVLYLERNNLELIKKYNKKKAVIFELQKELGKLTDRYNKNHKSLDISIKNEEIEVQRLKEIYFSLKSSKDLLEDDIKKHSFWNRLLAEKKSKINELSSIEVAELETIIDEAKFDKLFKKFPLHFTCVSYYISNILKIIKNRAPEFFAFKDNSFVDKTFLTLRNLERIMTMNYNQNNLFNINDNILIMLFILEKSVEKLLKQINSYHQNLELSKFIKKKLKEKEIHRKLRNISHKDNIKQEFRNSILNKLTEKQNKFVFRNKRIFSNSPPFIKIIHKYDKKKNQIKKEDINSKYNTLENL